MEQLYGLPALTRRDGTAHHFAHLLSADTPRDAPLTLPDPADSGFTCEEDAAGPHVTVSAERPISATMRGFVETAAIQEARLRPAEREQVRQRAAAVGTVGEAARYLTDVKGQLSASGLRTAGPPGTPRAE